MGGGIGCHLVPAHGTLNGLFPRLAYHILTACTMAAFFSSSYHLCLVKASLPTSLTSVQIDRRHHTTGPRTDCSRLDTWAHPHFHEGDLGTNS